MRGPGQAGAHILLVIQQEHVVYMKKEVRLADRYHKLEVELTFTFR